MAYLLIYLLKIMIQIFLHFSPDFNQLCFCAFQLYLLSTFKKITSSYQNHAIHHRLADYPSSQVSSWVTMYPVRLQEHQNQLIMRDTRFVYLLEGVDTKSVCSCASYNKVTLVKKTRTSPIAFSYDLSWNDFKVANINNFLSIYFLVY